MICCTVSPFRRSVVRITSRLNPQGAAHASKGIPMQNHTDGLIAALAGFALTGAVMAPPVLSARAEKADRIAAYEQVLGTSTTRFGSDRAGRLASALRDSDYRDEARQHMVAEQRKGSQ
jgi:hypothetical protein